MKKNKEYAVAGFLFLLICQILRTFHHISSVIIPTPNCMQLFTAIAFVELTHSSSTVCAIAQVGTVKPAIVDCPCIQSKHQGLFHSKYSTLLSTHNGGIGCELKRCAGYTSLHNYNPISPNISKFTFSLQLGWSENQLEANSQCKLCTMSLGTCGFLNSSNKFACLCGRSNTTSVCHSKLFIAVQHIMENCALLATLPVISE
jgi:hypothetical protein